jgi:hypothetical protein
MLKDLLRHSIFLVHYSAVQKRIEQQVAKLRNLKRVVGLEGGRRVRGSEGDTRVQGFKGDTRVRGWLGAVGHRHLIAYGLNC